MSLSVASLEPAQPLMSWSSMGRVRALGYAPKVPCRRRLEPDPANCFRDGPQS